jgi:hypothetical protein
MDRPSSFAGASRLPQAWREYIAVGLCICEESSRIWPLTDKKNNGKVVKVQRTHLNARRCDQHERKKFKAAKKSCSNKNVGDYRDAKPRSAQLKLDWVTPSGLEYVCAKICTDLKICSELKSVSKPEKGTALF